MPLFLLQPKKLKDGSNVSVFREEDIFLGFVIRAGDEHEARRWASERACYYDLWENPKSTTCERIDPDGPPGIVMEAYGDGR